MCIIRLYLKHFPIVQPQQWRNYVITLQKNQTITETLPITATKNFVAILSDTDCSNGVASDLSGGSRIINISNNTIQWTYNWNANNYMMINIIVLGII